jgi:hypothetical protein
MRELCEHLAADPGRWAPEILRLPAEDAPPREVSETADRPPARGWGNAPAPVPPDEPPLPGLAQRAVNLAGTFGAVVTHAVTTGELTASQGVQEARWRVCRGGEGLAADQTLGGHCDRFRPSDAACSECGCNLPAKISLAAMRCPLGRWPE